MNVRALGITMRLYLTRVSVSLPKALPLYLYITHYPYVYPGKDSLTVIGTKTKILKLQLTAHGTDSNFKLCAQLSFLKSTAE